MEIFRYSRNVYGQATLEGMAFELVWLFIGIAAVIIVGHLLYKRASDKSGRNNNPA